MGSTVLPGNYKHLSVSLPTTEHKRQLTGCRPTSCCDHRLKHDPGRAADKATIRGFYCFHQLRRHQ